MSERGLSAARVRGSALVRRFGANAVAMIVPTVAAVFLTPLILGGLGPDRYGVWALVGTATAFALTMDFGLAATMARFAGRAHGAGDREAGSRLLWTMSAIIVAACLVVAATGVAWGPLLIHVLHVPKSAVPQTRAVLPLAGVLIAVPAVVGLMTAFLQGWHDYGTVAASAVLAQATWAAAVLTLRSQGSISLRSIALSFIASQALGCLLLVAAAARHVGAPSQRWMRRSELGEVFAFARGMQVANLWAFINLEADAVIVAVLLPVRYVGFYAIGASVATGLRQLPMLFLTPIYTHLSNQSASLDEADLRSESVRVQQRWIRGVSGYALPAIPIAFVAVLAWVGSGYTTAATIAVILAAGNAVNLGTGVLSSYVRVVGRPRLEARYGAISTVVNITLTLALVVPAGAIGVATATAVGQLVGSTYFVKLAKAVPCPIPAFWRGVPWRSVAPSTLCAAAVCAATAAGATSRLVLLACAVLAVAVAASVYIALDFWPRSRSLLFAREPEGTSDIRVPR